MKITYVENVRIPSERAHAYQIAQCCLWLGRFGHDVTLVNPDRADGRDVFDFFHIDDRPFTHTLLPTLDALRIPCSCLKPIAYAIQRRSFVQSLRRWSKKVTSGVWYTRDPAMIDGLRGVVRGPWILELHDAPDASPARWARVKSIVTGYVVISVGLKADLVSRFGISENRIAVAPDGFDPTEFKTLPTKAEIRRELGIPEQAFVVMYTGSFFAWKGLDPVVRAWSKGPGDAFLLLVGGPKGDRERLERLIDASARDRIRIIPTLPRRESTRFYAAADMGLLASSPSHEIARRFTSPIKQFEYMAAGLPILASDVPSSHEVLNPSMAVFYDSTEQGFINRLREVIDDDAWRQSASARVREVVQRYTWEARARRISNFIERIRK